MSHSDIWSKTTKTIRGRLTNTDPSIRRPPSLRSRAARVEQLEDRATPGSLLASLPGLFAAPGLGNRVQAAQATEAFETSIQRRTGGANLSILPRTRDIELAQRRNGPRPTTPSVPTSPPLQFHSIVDAASNGSSTGPEINLGFRFGSFADTQGAPDSRDATEHGLGDVLPHVPTSLLTSEGGASFDPAVHLSGASNGSSGGGANPFDTADGNASSSAQGAAFFGSPPLRVASQTADPGNSSTGSATAQPSTSQSAAPLPGDVNADRLVNIFDINTISANWGSATNAGVPLPPQPADSPMLAMGFSGGLRGWDVSQSGGSAVGRGTVVTDQGNALLTEGDSFLVTLAHTFTVPER